MTDSLRDSLSAAFDEAEKAAEADQVVDVEATTVEDTGQETTDLVDPAADTGADTPSTAEAAPASTTDTPAATDTPSATDTSTDTPAIDPKDPVAKAPGSWTPAAREEWANVPATVKQEVWKREREASRALTVSADARRLQQEFSQTIQPYLGFIVAENSTPLKAVDQMMRTAAVLRVGTAQQKVQLVAQTIKQFGVDLEQLDAFLAGQAPAAVDPATLVQQQVQQALAPILNERRQQTQFAQQRQQQEQQCPRHGHPEGQLEAQRADRKSVV